MSGRVGFRFGEEWRRDAVFRQQSIALDGADAPCEEFYVESRGMPFHDFLAGFAAKGFRDLCRAGDPVDDNADAQRASAS